ncbi:MAG TPA: hypothetical protein VGR82_16455 [Methylomirabilota bacterium]|nr:hypothetical protein [Methylomirabilota bacterium]
MRREIPRPADYDDGDADFRGAADGDRRWQRLVMAVSVLAIAMIVVMIIVSS